MSIRHDQSLLAGLILSIIGTSGPYCSGVPLNFVSFSVGTPRSGYNPLVTDPAFAVALDEMSEHYPRMFRNYTWTAKSTLDESACTDDGREGVFDAIVSLLAEHKMDLRDSETIFLAPREF